MSQHCQQTKSQMGPQKWRVVDSLPSHAGIFNTVNDCVNLSEQKLRSVGGAITMSGTVRVRKQWQLQEGPKGTLRRLRSQLAEDGCVDSQVVVAKQLLEEAQLGGDFTEQTAQAVHWLTRASEYGSEEAVELLRKCYRSGTGITKENFTSVRLCLAMSPEEKSLRTAARDLFTALTPFGQDFVTTNQLQSRLGQLDRGGGGDCVGSGSLSEKDKVAGRDSPDSSFTKWYQDSGIFDGECLTEAGLIEAASRVARGEVPDVSLLVEQRRRRTTDDGEQRISFRNKVALMLWQVLTSSLSSRSLDLSAKYGESLLGLLTWNNGRIVVLVMLCNILTLDTVRQVLPAVTFYVAFAIMCLSTVQLLRQRRGLQTVDRWVRLFRTAHSELDSDRLQQTFHLRRLRRHHFRFFGATLIVLVAYPLADAKVLLRADLASVAIGFAVAGLLGIDRPVRRTVAFTCLLLANFLSRLRTLSATEWTTTVALSPHLIVTVSPDSFPGFAVAIYLAWSSRRGGFYRSALPDAVVLVWLQLACTFVSDAEAGWNDFVRGAMAWGCMLAMPLVVVAMMAALVIYGLWMVGKLVSQWEIDYLVVVPTAIAVAMATLWFRRWQRKVDSSSGDVSCRWVLRRYWLVVLMVGLIVPLLLLSPVVLLDKPGLALPRNRNVSLTWDAYHRLCHQTARTKLSAAVVAERCSVFAGVPVRWRGQVREVVLSATHNHLEDLMLLLPEGLAGYLRCVFGEEYGRCASDVSQTDGGADLGGDEFMSFWYCRALEGIEGRCHLRQWDRHEFEIAVRIRSEGYWNPVTVVLLNAGHDFKDFATKLVAGDEISFSGVVLRAGPAGSQRPAVRVESITCDDCSRNGLKQCAVDELDGLDVAFGQSLSSVVNHIFYPFLQYHPASNRSA